MDIKFRITGTFANGTIPMPKPAKNYIPEWYKKIRQNTNEYNNGAIKRCMPFFDGLSSGYIQELWTDINIVRTGANSVEYNYALGPAPIEIRPISNFDIPDNYYNIEFIWKQHWIPQLPKGWSMLFTTPNNRVDLPFRCMDAIVDSDDFNYVAEAGGNFPFLLNKGFTGIIPAGTPMFQMIPIKRESWKAIEEPFDLLDNIRNVSKIKKYFKNGYKNVHWKKKEYE